MPPRQDRTSVVTVGTYPPTRCGLATFTANLRAAVAGPQVEVDVVRLVNAEDQRVRTPEVVAEWRRDDPVVPAAVVKAANGADAVLLQHEFGIFPGHDGAAVTTFLNRVRVPVVSVLHTVLAHPGAGQARVLDAVVARSATVVVQTEAARRRLVSATLVDPARVEVIPHGAALNLRGPVPLGGSRPRLLTWGLLGPGKGLEYAIDAVADLQRHGIAVDYVIAGDVHPAVRAATGDSYRHALAERVQARGVDGLVRFDGGYRDWESLRELVRSADIVLLPYESREQVTSGVLVEALAAGKPVIATAFPHAVELAASGAVAVVPHEQPAAMARALAAVLSQPAEAHRMAAAAARVARGHDWPAVGERYRSVIATACHERRAVGSVA